MTAETLTASCLCGTVRYEIRGTTPYADWCHCSKCRKMSGTVGDPGALYLTKQVTLVQGAGNIRTYAPPEFTARSFCVTCGSPAPLTERDGPLMSIPMGLFDADPGVRPVLRKQVAYKAPWHTIPGDVPRFDEYPTADELERMGFRVPDSYREQPPREGITPKWQQDTVGPPVTGGCFCGGVRYEVTGPFLRANDCHCTRCRKHSGSFGLTQGRVAPEHFRILQGDDLLVNYTEAKHAAKVFCSRCGSSVLGGEWPGGKTVSVRFGGLDGDPGIRVQFHTFVADKAPWFDITDDLPQFPGRATKDDMVRPGIAMP